MIRLQENIDFKTMLELTLSELNLDQNYTTDFNTDIINDQAINLTASEKCSIN